MTPQPFSGVPIATEIGDTIHLPVPRPSYFFGATEAADLATIQGLAIQDPDSALVGAATKVQVHEGAITLPYFQQLPGEDGSGIVTGSWSR